MLSFCIPAKNEELNLPETVKAVREACEALGVQYEIVVCENGSKDKTLKVARELGAKVIMEQIPHISKARNSAAKAATGDTLIFLDADTKIHSKMLRETLSALKSKKYRVVSTITHYDTYPSAAIFVWIYNVLSLFFKLGLGQYTTLSKKDFVTLGGFDETVYAFEDIYFYKTVKRTFGRKSIKILWNGPVTSARKFKGRYNLFKPFLGLIKATLNKKAATTKHDLEYWYGGDEI